MKQEAKGVLLPRSTLVICTSTDDVLLSDELYMLA